MGEPSARLHRSHDLVMMPDMVAIADEWVRNLPAWAKELLHPWVLFGFLGQAVFGARFVIQWIVSERKGRSHVPVVFWYISLAGGLMLFTYAIQRRDPVFICGQGLGCFIYIRNLMLIHKRTQRRRNADAQPVHPVESDSASAMGTPLD